MSHKLAIAYAMKRKAQKKAKGGEVKGVNKSEYEMPAKAMDKYKKHNAGESKAGEHARMAKENKGFKGSMAREKAVDSHHKVLGEMARIQPKLQGLSKGGKVKGVHEAVVHGDSKAGGYAQFAHELKQKGTEEHDKTAEKMLEMARGEHREKLHELKTMAKPKLQGLSDGGIAGSNVNSVQSSMRKAFGSSDSKSSSSASNGVPSTSDSGYSPDEAAKRQAVRKSYGYALGGEVYKPAHLMDQIHVDKHLGEDMLTGDGYYIQPSNFDKAHIAHNDPAKHEDNMRFNQKYPDMDESTDMHEQSLVDRIMRQPSQDFEGAERLAHGGKVKGVNRASKQYGATEGTSQVGMAVRHGNYDRAKDLIKDKTYELRKMADPKLQGLSEGGMVANDTGTGQESDEMPNQFDDLVLRDHLESAYGDDDNAGDSLGNSQEDMDRKDIVARIMKSWGKKDKLPNPR